jgi:hypothetical protein
MKSNGSRKRGQKLGLQANNHQKEKEKQSLSGDPIAWDRYLGLFFSSKPHNLVIISPTCLASQGGFARQWTTQARKPRAAKATFVELKQIARGIREETTIVCGVASVEAQALRLSGGSNE